jgi:AcrR family transcriptional regulator
MSSATPNVALAPKRAPGRQRVSAILAAARVVFAERGYDAATMTEIAARSHTAIGSLYRFFPTKELVAEALLVDYAERVGAALSEIEAQASALAPAALADAFIDLMLRSRADHDVAVALLDGRGDAAELRNWLRRTARRQIRGILLAAAPSLAMDRIDAVAAVLQQLMKSVVALAAEDTPNGPLLAELRGLARLYLGQVLGERFLAG